MALDGEAGGVHESFVEVGKARKEGVLRRSGCLCLEAGWSGELGRGTGELGRAIEADGMRRGIEPVLCAEVSVGREEGRRFNVGGGRLEGGEVRFERIVDAEKGKGSLTDGSIGVALEISGLVAGEERTRDDIDIMLESLSLPLSGAESGLERLEPPR